MLDIRGVRSEVNRCGDKLENFYGSLRRLLELTKKDAEVQAATLKMVMGKECRQILTQLELTEEK